MRFERNRKDENVLSFAATRGERTDTSQVREWITEPL